MYHERLAHQNKRHVRQVIEQEFGLKVKSTQSDICESIYRHIYFLSHKPKAASKLTLFLEQAKVARHTVKEMLSGNGGEFTSNEFKNILAQCGIKQRFTMPDTPEQNGYVKRKNRTVVEAARAIMHAHENNS